MQRAKIKRKKERMPDESEQRKIMAASHMALATTFIFLHLEYGWGEKRCRDIINAYWNVMTSIHSRSIAREQLTGLVVTPSEVMQVAQEFCTERLATLPIRAKDRYMLEADRLTMTCMIIALKSMGFGKQRMSLWIESYLALTNEVFNRYQPTTVRDMIDWANECVGIDVAVALTWN